MNKATALAVAPGAEAEQAKVYVLILNWNGWEHTLECLESVLRLRYPNFQVVVCDNASDDGSVERIQAWARGEIAAPSPASTSLRPLLRSALGRPMTLTLYDRATAEAGGVAGHGADIILIRTGKNGGFAFGNNVGLRYIMAQSDARYVWLLNNDTVVNADALDHLVACADERGAGIVGAKLLCYGNPDRIQAAGGGALSRWNGLTLLQGAGEMDDGRWDGAVDLEYVHGASLLARTDLVQEIGLLDEAYFMYSEEVDWCLRARKAGWQLDYAPAARVWHKEGSAALGGCGDVRDFHGLRSRLILIRKFYPFLLPLALIHSVYRCVLPKVLRRQPERLRVVLQAYADFFARA